MAKPMVLIVRDGWGYNPNPEHNRFNAVLQARTPRHDALVDAYPWTLIKASGEAVGLPAGTIGNSEVGHQALGAGRVVLQESVRISRAIADGGFFSNEALLKAIDNAMANDRYLHVMGIASDAGVHGLLEHLYSVLELAARAGIQNVALHLFTDGRDTGPFSGREFLHQIETRCRDIGVGRVATICGRYYAMDRDNRWDRVQLAYDALTGRAWTPVFESAEEAVTDYYEQPTSDSQQGDEFITPRRVEPDAHGTRIRAGDSVVFCNYRGDRPRELTRAFMQPDFGAQVGDKQFDRGEKLDITFVCMTAYDESFNDFPGLYVAFPKPERAPDIGGEYLSRLGKTQFRVAESEKFAHVTFFFNDYRKEPFEGEHRWMVQSPKVATYDQKPEMSAESVRDAVLCRLQTDDCEDFFLVNFANPDMVGHTGNFEATVSAIETVDQCVGAIVDATLERGGKLIVTADHGNAEQMWDPDTDAPHTAHTNYDVECIIVDDELSRCATTLRDNGRLADVFPTCLMLMRMEKPAAMTGESLLNQDRYP